MDLQTNIYVRSAVGVCNYIQLYFNYIFMKGGYVRLRPFTVRLPTILMKIKLDETSLGVFDLYAVIVLTGRNMNKQLRYYHAYYYT